MSLKGHGIAYIGRDPELRYTPNGQPVMNIALAFSFRDKSGQDATQWVDGTLWGKQAESLSQYLAKGKRVAVDIRNVRIEKYDGKNGSGSKLVGDIVDIEFASSKSEDGQQRSQPQEERKAPPAQAPRPQTRQPAPPPSSGFDDMDSDDIPFISCDWALEIETSKAKRMRKYDY